MGTDALNQLNFLELDIGYNQLQYYVYTSATSGNISTKYFGETFDDTKVDGYIQITIIVYVPQSPKVDQNTTLMFDINKNTMEGVRDNDWMMAVYDIIDADLTHWRKNISVSSSYYNIILDRKVSANDIDNMDLDVMPGFRFTWNYDKNVEPWTKYSIKQKYKQKYLMKL